VNPALRGGFDACATIALMPSYTVVLETARPEEVDAVRRALAEAAIPFTSGLLADGQPRVVFSVPRERVAEARAAIVPLVVPDGWIEDDDLRDGGGRRPAETGALPTASWSAEQAMDRLDEVLGESLELVGFDPSTGASRPADATLDGDDVEFPVRPAPAKFPWRPVATVAALVAVHVAVVLVGGASREAGRALLDAGVLLRGSVLAEPWRLLTSLFLHADLRHALANAISTFAFAVPLLERLGFRRTAGIYLVSGVGGGITALSLARVGQAFLGSSGAVAGLFGAWAVIAFDRAGAEVLPGRARLRTAGVALLVLPSLLTPFTPDGRPVSVASHVGGLVTGMLIGAVLSGLAERWRGDDPMFGA